MSAKLQPMQDATDDLIAELTKLMAEDAKGGADAQAARAEQEKAAQARPSTPFSIRIPGEQPKPAAPTRLDFSVAKASTNAAVPGSQSGDIGVSNRADTGAVPSAAAESGRDSIADLITAELAGDAGEGQASSPAELPNTAAASQPEPAQRNAHAIDAAWKPVIVSDEAGSHKLADQPAPRPVNHEPAVRTERDQFKVPPVFGLSSGANTNVAKVEPVAPSPAMSTDAVVKAQPKVAPAAVLPQVPPAPVEADLDPLEEIENLIGKAIRVDATPVVAQAAPVASPALRTLATPTLQRANTDTGRVSTADDAILAAAEASGAQIGWVDVPETALANDEPRAKRERSAGPRRGFSRAVAGPLVAVLLLTIAGGGLYWVLGNNQPAGPAPLLTADASPAKETPAPAADAAPAQQSVVFNEIDGVDPAAEEQLVSRDQADTNEVAQINLPAVIQEGLANRKVRTVTVRPDGTIVSGDEAVAGNAMLPVDRPDVPAIPGADTSTPTLLASANTDAAATAAIPPTPAVAAPSEDVAAAAAPQVPPVEPGTTVAAVDLQGNPLAGKTTVIPLLRPASLSQAALASTASQPSSPVNAVVDGALPSLPPAPVAGAANPLNQAVEVAAVQNNAPAYVQLASQRSEADARQSASALVTRYGPLFGGASLEVQQVDLGTQGTVYRVRVPADSRDHANNICVNVKAAGGDCFVM